jgi:hypothetical protein
MYQYVIEWLYFHPENKNDEAKQDNVGRIFYEAEDQGFEWVILESVPEKFVRNSHWEEGPSGRHDEEEADDSGS